jgi:arylsulfatase/uncharacterized sulfatase
LVGLPARSTANEAVPIRGRSLVPVLSGQADEVYGADDAIGIEVATNAALYKGDWKLQKMPHPASDGQWRLYNLANDLGETRDVKQDYPDIFAELKSDYAAYAAEVGIVDLGDAYSPMRQIASDFALSILAFIWPYALGFLLIFLSTIIFGVRFIRAR